MLKNEEKVQEWEDLKESLKWENRAVIKARGFPPATTLYECGIGKWRKIKPRENPNCLIPPTLLHPFLLYLPGNLKS